MPVSQYRPTGHQGTSDARLPRIARKLRRRLALAQESFAHDTLRLDDDSLEDLADILVEFAFDLRCGTGIWASYEACNTQWFGAPLPLAAGPHSGRDLRGLHHARLRHLLWVVYPELKEGLVLAPLHQDLLRVADAAQASLSESLASVPPDSAVKRFLASPNRYGWDVKRKLIWLGTRSYMFRLFYRDYLASKSDEESDISRTDDFICGVCTRWSGLGAVDILAAVLDITDEERRELTSWRERHVAPYKILSADGQFLRALNVVSDQEYVVRVNGDGNLFKVGQLVYGGLVPWRGEWYWSGMQHAFPEATQDVIQSMKQHMKRHATHVVCRYSKEYEQQVRESAEALHQQMLDYYGTDLIAYPDGQSMELDWQKALRQRNKGRSQEEVTAVMERHGLGDFPSRIPLPDSLRQCSDGVAVFLNPDEGMEIMQGFSTVAEALRRRGTNLTEDQKEAIRAIIRAPAISPRFVKRMVEEYGEESIRWAWKLKADSPDHTLDYLLRRYKGHFFRKRYPALSVL
ncbi:MAG: hypothetical protein ACLF0G_07580 [Candidatus Brocadiia bacterium]